MVERCRGSGRRWLVLAGAFFAVFFELGTLKSLGLLITDMTVDLRSSTALLGMAIGLSHGLSQLLGKMLLFHSIPCACQSHGKDEVKIF